MMLQRAFAQMQQEKVSDYYGPLLCGRDAGGVASSLIIP